MICYTLSDCVIEGIINRKNMRKGYAGLLMGFASESIYPDCKLAIDKNGRAVEAYLSHDSLLISEWVKFMGECPSKWELIDLEESETGPNPPPNAEDIFKEICSNTADKIMIVYSYNGWVLNISTRKGTIEHKGIPLSIWDYSDAIARIMKNPENVIHNQYNVQGGVVLGEGASSKNIHVETSAPQSFNGNEQ